MTKKVKILLGLFLVVFFSTQLYLTVFGGFLWPFSGHRLFSQLGARKKTIVQAVLTDAEGYQYFTHPGKVIPIEYSRCSGLIRKLYAEGAGIKQKTFCQYLLHRLNTAPWHAFDEMFPAIRPHSQSKFVQLHFEHHDIEFLPDSYPNSIRLVERRHLFP